MKMVSKDQLKELNIKNTASYYFDDIIRGFDINLYNIWLEEKLYENISVYDISYKTSAGPKPLCIRFDKIDRFIRVCGSEFRFWVLFDHGLFDKIVDKIKYLISDYVVLQIVLIIILERSELIYIILYLLKKYWFFIMLLLIKSVVNKNKNRNYYNIFLEKSSYRDKSDTRYF